MATTASKFALQGEKRNPSEKMHELSSRIAELKQVMHGPAQEVRLKAERDILPPALTPQGAGTDSRGRTGAKEFAQTIRDGAVEVSSPLLRFGGRRMIINRGRLFGLGAEHHAAVSEKLELVLGALETRRASLRSAMFFVPHLTQLFERIRCGNRGFTSSWVVPTFEKKAPKPLCAAWTGWYQVKRREKCHKKST